MPPGGGRGRGRTEIYRLTAERSRRRGGGGERRGHGTQAANSHLRSPREVAAGFAGLSCSVQAEASRWQLEPAPADYYQPSDFLALDRTAQRPHISGLPFPPGPLTYGRPGQRPIEFGIGLLNPPIWALMGKMPYVLMHKWA